MTHLKAGDPIPHFVARSHNGEDISSETLKGKKSIIYFYPKDNTPGCTAEACDFRDNFQFWKEKAYSIIGISPDSEASHLKFAAKYELPFPLISDPDKAIIRSFGVWGPKKFMGREYEGVYRTTFVVSETGIIEDIFDKVKTKEHSNQIIKALDV